MTEIDELIEELNNRNIDSSLRRNAIRDLGSIGGAKTVEALIEALADEENSIRSAAASTLGRLGDQRAVDSLIKALQDEDNYVRKNAATALGRLGDKRAIEPLQKLTSDMFITVRTTARESLQLLTDGNEVQVTSEFMSSAAKHQDFPKLEEATLPETSPGVETSSHAEARLKSGIQEDKTVLDVSGGDEPTPPELTDESVVPDEKKPQKGDVQKPPENIDIPDKETEGEVLAEAPEEDELTVIETPSYDEDSEQLPQYVPGERMSIFFQDDIEPIKKVYQQLSDKQKLLREIESQIKSEMEKLTSEQSAKGDSIVKYNETVRRMEKHTEAMQAEYESALFERAEVADRLNSKVRTFVASIFRKKNESQERLAQLDARIMELKQRIEEGDRKLEGQRKEYDGLSVTTDSSQTELEELEKRRTSCESEISSLNSKIEDSIINVIQPASFVEFERKIERLAEARLKSGIQTDNIDFFRTCATRLRGLLIERNHILERVESSSTALESAQEQAQNSLNVVCEAIADGFYTTNTPKKANAKISGAVTFKEAKNAFDISGVTGSVSGSGSGTANYTLDEPAWKATQELRKQVGKMTGAWASLGEATGDFELYSAKQNMLKIGISEYAHFIRVELEKDFYDK